MRRLVVAAAVLLVAACGSPESASTLRDDPSSSPTDASGSADPSATAAATGDTGGVRTSEPDASTVPAPTRTPPAATHSPTPADESGISGRVVAGPTCPVERVDSPCPDRPVTDAQVTISRAGFRKSTKTNAQGRFAIDAPPGTYHVTASSPSVFGCDDQTVRVEKERVSDVTITCDTGIR